MKDNIVMFEPEKREVVSEAKGLLNIIDSCKGMSYNQIRIIAGFPLDNHYEVGSNKRRKP